ncbi:MAG: hypothetical protein H6756_13795 [Candidatus Omnitrophica bacterium]|nr:hypothetical protein [Candidatus Omnitrophota bacterium]
MSARIWHISVAIEESVVSAEQMMPEMNTFGRRNPRDYACQTAWNPAGTDFATLFSAKTKHILLIHTLLSKNVFLKKKAMTIRRHGFSFCP